MGSKKLRMAKQAAKPASEESATSVKKKLVKPKSFILGKSNEPIYKALLMAVAVAVLAFLLNWILNSVFTNIVSSQNPDISNNSTLLLEKVREYISNNIYYPALQKSVLEASGILAVIFFFKRIEKSDISEMGFANKQKIGANIGLGSLMGFLAVLIAFNFLLLLNGAEFTGKLVLHPVQIVWLIEFILMILCEEFIFRGYVRYKLANTKPVVMYAVSCVLFALYKGYPSTSPATYISYAAMNFFLMFAYVQLNSPYFGMAFRFVWTVLCGIVFPVYSGIVPGLFQMQWNKENILTGLDKGFEHGLIAAFVFIIAYLGVKLIISGKLKPGEKKYQRRLQKDGTIR